MNSMHNPQSQTNTMNPTLLVELFTEELPPKVLKQLGQAFADLLTEHLKQAGHLSGAAKPACLPAQGRLACTISDVLARSPDKPEKTRLLPVKIGLDASGKPTAPLLKKLASLGLENFSLTDLLTESDGKQEVLCVNRTLEGQQLETSLQAALEQATTRLPIPKIMSYQLASGDTVHFVRPVHKLVVLHGDKVVPVHILGLEANRITRGHRFMGQGIVNIASAESYAQQLETEGKVIACFEKRQALIAQQLVSLAGTSQVVAPPELLEEVTALVEWPATYEAHFDAEFLQVPQACLILTMQANQKYFALTDATAQARPTGNATSAQGTMQTGFCWFPTWPRQHPNLLFPATNACCAPAWPMPNSFSIKTAKNAGKPPSRPAKRGLSQQTRHPKNRNARLVALAGHLAAPCGANPAHAARAALLCKADLLTDMVGEFPELQGTMGEHYALHDGEPPEVAQAIADHYRPRFAGDALPRNPAGLTVALADKLETLVGIYGIGLIPTGDKDPFALRRHALGVVRMVIEHKVALDIPATLQKTASLFDTFTDFKPEHLAGLYGFVIDRLKSYLKDQAYTAAEVDSVVSQSPAFFADLPARLNAVRQFSQLPEAQALAAANKRIGNILKKAGNTGLEPATPIQAELLLEAAEKNLFAHLQTIRPSVEHAYQQSDFTQSLLLLAPLKADVDAFFNQVMV
ncbi:MAG: glycine--tRNA ligase subunit beta, partial [Limnobacter sp.]|nr:glycine--tRNA ligase subunit beta [Limnobacter sp.]